MKVYLDNAATTQISEEVQELLIEINKSNYANPSSTHSFGRETRIIIENARKSIAKLLNTVPGCIFFTSGGTESDNMAINCAIKDHEISHAITTKIEHHAVLYPLQQLEKAGNIKLSYVDVNSDGLICLESLEKILKNSSRSFVSIMHANNEIGTIQDISLIGDICKKYNAIFHSDTVQTVGHYPIDLKSLNVDFTFVFLDDDFYHFTDSDFPQFLNINDSIKILKKFINPKENKEISKKIYVTREDSNYRKIINEGDVVTLLREKGYKVINPQLYEIDEQIEIFANAEKIISPHGSNLANIIFCKPGTEIVEIAPFFRENEKIFDNKYANLCHINSLKHNRILSDSVDVEKHSILAKKYIHPNVLSQSNYYKNLIVKIQDINKVI